MAKGRFNGAFALAALPANHGVFLMNRAMLLREKIARLPVILSNIGVTITQEGTSAYVRCDQTGKPTTVNLPYLADTASEELMDAIEGFLDHEVAHLLFTDFNLTSRSRKEGFGALHELLEDALVELQMGRRFPGSAANLSETGSFFLRRAVVPALHSEAAHDPSAVQGILMAPALRAWAGQLVYEEFMRPHWQKMRDVCAALGPLVHEIGQCKNTTDTYALAEKMAKALNAYDPSLMQSAPEEGAAGDSNGAEEPPDAGLSQEAASGQPGQRREPVGEGRRAARAAPPEQQSGLNRAPKFDAIEEDRDVSNGREGEAGQEGQPGQEGQASLDETLRGQGELGEGAEQLGRNSFSISSVNKMLENGFDQQLIQLISGHAVAANDTTPYRVYSTAQDTIEPLPVPDHPELENWLQELERKVLHLCGPMQKNLERLIAARSIATWQPARRSGRLHAASLSRLACDDARVFRKKIEGRSRDVAVELVVDCSGSMGGAKLYLATQAAYALSTVLGRLNIANEVIGFTTDEWDLCESPAFRAEQSQHAWVYARYESLYMPILKGYNERMTANVRNRFAWLPHSGILNYNVDGESVEIAARRLAQRRENGKILLVLSDGAPAAHGNDAMLEKHLKKVVKEIEQSGINVVGLGIHSTAVRHFYSKYLIVKDIEQLPTEVLKQLKELIILD
jgi:cobaltochelatase CobT